MSSDNAFEPRPPAPPARAAAGGPARPRSLTPWLAAAALGAGLLGWSVGESRLEQFTLTAAEAGSGVAGYTAQDNTPYRMGKRRVAIWNAALHEAVLGAALGLTLGGAGGLARRSAGGALAGGLTGSLAAGAGAALASLALVPVFLTYYHPDRPNLFLPVLVHGAVWAALAAGAGLGLAAGLGGDARRAAAAASGAAAGALAGAFVFEVVYAVAFPLARSESPVPSEPSSRLLAALTVALSAVLGASRRLTRRPPAPGAG